MENKRNKPMVEYLDLDENTYIENDIIKTRISEKEASETFIPWEEFWNKVYDGICKIKEYDETHN